jgi:hypothetical protein
MFKRHDLVEVKATASRYESTLAIFLHANGIRAHVLFWLPKSRCFSDALTINVVDVVALAERVSKVARQAHADHVDGEARIAKANGMTLATMYPGEVRESDGGSRLA